MRCALGQADLEAIRKVLLQRRGALINVTGDEKTLMAADPHITAFLDSLPAEAGADADWSNTIPAINEALTVPTQVCSTCDIFFPPFFCTLSFVHCAHAAYDLCPPDMVKVRKWAINTRHVGIVSVALLDFPFVPKC